MLFIGLNYALLNFIAVIAGIFFSFKTQGTFVFRNSNNRLLGRFVICWLGIYTVNVLFIKLGIGLGLNAYAAGALALPLITVLAYLTQKLFVFRNSK
jgi:putative flippase GtrA